MNNNNNSTGLGLGSVLTIIFVVLKLIGVIDWSWWWVVSPTLIETCLCVLVIIGCNIYSAQRKKSAQRSGTRCATICRKEHLGMVNTTFYNTQICGSTTVQGNQVWIDGVALPPAPCKGHNSTVIDGKVYLDGYEFKKGKWRRTLRAFWHLWF